MRASRSVCWLQRARPRLHASHRGACVASLPAVHFQAMLETSCKCMPILHKFVTLSLRGLYITCLDHIRTHISTRQDSLGFHGRTHIIHNIQRLNLCVHVCTLVCLYEKNSCLYMQASCRRVGVCVLIRVSVRLIPACLLVCVCGS
jgi:hypothetical protein